MYDETSNHSSMEYDHTGSSIRRKRCRSSSNKMINNNNSFTNFPSTTIKTSRTTTRRRTTVVSQTTESLRIINMIIMTISRRISTTVFTFLLISNSVQCFQPAKASKSQSQHHYHTNKSHIVTKLYHDIFRTTTATTTTTTSNSASTTATSTNQQQQHKPNHKWDMIFTPRRRRMNTHLSASTTIPSSSSSKSSPSLLFFRDSTTDAQQHQVSSRVILPKQQQPSKHDSSTNTNSSSYCSSPSLSSTTSTSSSRNDKVQSSSSVIDTKHQNKLLQQQQQKLPLNMSAQKAWEMKYCSVSGLRESFGTNRNMFWGDYDASTTRRLYKCLLPVALLELYEAGHVPPQDLAPLAYRARVAAKLYARERSHVPARIIAAMFDGYRQWRKYGIFDTTGMSYDQVWNKYAAMITQETASSSSTSKRLSDSTIMMNADDTTHNSTNSITARICLKILERSCQSNEMIDRLVLKHSTNTGYYNNNHNHTIHTIKQRKRDLQQLKMVSEQLERDVRLLLQQPELDDIDDIDDDDPMTTTTNKHRHPTSSIVQQQQKQLQFQKFRALRAVAIVKRRIAKLQKQRLFLSNFIPSSISSNSTSTTLK